MSDKTFVKIVIAMVVIFTLLTAFHIFYDVYAYKYSSIIYFVSKEIW
ncbi:MAG: hypothetical protein J5685_02690 [Clostridiales bacterium]|nr:hypothetical protein [Clostridiales bacterium]